ncbi:methylamine utilization protein [Pseudoalteromonas sp. S558]|uniref:methylamine utilization protein n=1 Tax=Pseudoalteromonas sp. S558 TaxID=2066515 RepID=UPI00110AE78E|nr:methylamine utilization protein [Pseudoalteromonas sp. S558]TMN94268.1 methylamine utilization protein [Pseudoalteromonas sp. S558]
MIKFFAFTILMVSSWQAAAVSIIIKNTKNEPIANAVVWLTAKNTSEKITLPSTLYSMSQKNREFTPRILVVPQNAKVEFPNADSIMHHVYSFSEAKTFELKLYKEQPKAPLVFEQTGVVELGCNIHDWMLGYIVVVDSTIFAITDDTGKVELTAVAGEYKLSVWHSGFGDISNVESEPVTISSTPLTYKVKQAIIEQIDFVTDEFDDYE